MDFFFWKCSCQQIKEQYLEPNILKELKTILLFTCWEIMQENVLKSLCFMQWNHSAFMRLNSEIITCNNLKWEAWCLQQHSLVPCWYEDMHRTWERYVLKIKIVAKWHDTIHVTADSNTLDSLCTWFLVVF